MTPLKARTLICWYVALCAAQVVVLGMVVCTLLSETLEFPGIDLFPGGEFGSVVLFGLAWLFLLIGSPFFFRSLGRAAWAGWILAVLVFILGIFCPIS